MLKKRIVWLLGCLLGLAAQFLCMREGKFGIS